MTVPDRVVITAAAADLVARLTRRHGPLMFHQSGGCCDGSAPMCYPDGDFLVGDHDVLLGSVAVDGTESTVPVWISGPQFAVWKHTQLILDAVPGRGAGFSLEAPEGLRFLSRSRAFTDAENAALDAAPPITGSDYQHCADDRSADERSAGEAAVRDQLPPGRAASLPH